MVIMPARMAIGIQGACSAVAALLRNHSLEHQRQLLIVPECCQELDSGREGGKQTQHSWQREAFS